MSEGNSPDLFISHASEDKDRFVRPLAEALRSLGVNIWYDEWELNVGDRLVERINDGLASSRYGAVVLSPSFFKKNWPRTELEALANLEMRDGRDRLLPIWLDIGSDELAELFPLLLGRIALKADVGIDEIARRLAEATGRQELRLPSAAPKPVRQLSPGDIAAQALPRSYAPALEHGENGFVFRTVTALRLELDRDAYLTSQHKRAFQAIVGDSSIEALVREFTDKPRQHNSAVWDQAQPNSGTVVTIERPVEAIGGQEGSLQARAGLLLRFYALGTTAHAVIHLDLVLRAAEAMGGGSLLSLDDFYSLLIIPAASVRDEVAPVMSALLADTEDPVFVAQSLVAMPQNDEFARYLDLSPYANSRVKDADGPSAVQWNASSTADFDDSAWKAAVVRMIDRLFSDGAFLEYEHSIERLASRGPIR